MVQFLKKQKKITKSNFTDSFDESSIAELKDKLEEILEVSNILDKHLQDKIKGPRIIEAHQKLSSEKKKD